MATNPTNTGSMHALDFVEGDLFVHAGNTGGPIAGHSEIVADGAGVSFATHIADVEVDMETGRSLIKRYTVIQDAGKAMHPAYVEGQYQGGAAQGIGWALNEEYIYGKDGRLHAVRLDRPVDGLGDGRVVSGPHARTAGTRLARCAAILRAPRLPRRDDHGHPRPTGPAT